MLGDWDEKETRATLRTAVQPLHPDARQACLAWFEATTVAGLRYDDDMRNMFVYLLRAVGFPGRRAIVQDFRMSEQVTVLVITGGAHARVIFKTSEIHYKEPIQMAKRQVQQLIEAGVGNLHLPVTFYVVDIHFHSIMFKKFSCDEKSLVDRPRDFHPEVDFTVVEQRQQLVDVLRNLKEQVDSEAEQLVLPPGFHQDLLHYYTFPAFVPAVPDRALF